MMKLVSLPKKSQDVSFMIIDMQTVMSVDQWP